MRFWMTILTRLQMWVKEHLKFLWLLCFLVMNQVIFMIYIKWPEDFVLQIMNTCQSLLLVVEPSLDWDNKCVRFHHVYV